MGLKLADTAEPMGNFPVAHAEDIDIEKTTGVYKSLQDMYDDGELGGSGEGALIMTSAEWNALEPEDIPADGTEVIITDDAGEGYAMRANGRSFDDFISSAYNGKYTWSAPATTPDFGDELYQVPSSSGRGESYNISTGTRGSKTAQTIELHSKAVERLTRTRYMSQGLTAVWTPWFGSYQIYSDSLKNVGMYDVNSSSPYLAEAVLKKSMTVSNVEVISGWNNIADVSSLNIRRILDLKVYDENGNIRGFDKCRINNNYLQIYTQTAGIVTEIAFEFLLENE